MGGREGIGEGREGGQGAYIDNTIPVYRDTIKWTADINFSRIPCHMQIGHVGDKKCIQLLWWPSKFRLVTCASPLSRTWLARS